MSIVKRPADIAALRQSGTLLAKIMRVLLAHVKSGITTQALDDLFRAEVGRVGGESAFLGYRGYKKAICTSVNDEVVHTLPSARVLRSGDVLSIDCGLRFQGWCTDITRTVGVGTMAPKAQRLIMVTQQALAIGTAQAVAGHTTGDIGAAIQQYVEQAGFSVVRKLVGHGIGREVHEEPALPNFGQAGAGVKLKLGMVLALEPMVNLGDSDVIFDRDGWTVRTADGTLSAHFEDTILVTGGQPEVLTK